MVTSTIFRTASTTLPPSETRRVLPAPTQVRSSPEAVSRPMEYRSPESEKSDTSDAQNSADTSTSNGSRYKRKMEGKPVQDSRKKYKKRKRATEPESGMPDPIAEPWKWMADRAAYLIRNHECSKWDKWEGELNEAAQRVGLNRHQLACCLMVKMELAHEQAKRGKELPDPPAPHYIAAHLTPAFKPG